METAKRFENFVSVANMADAIKAYANNIRVVDHMDFSWLKSNTQEMADLEARVPEFSDLVDKDVHIIVMFEDTSFILLGLAKNKIATLTFTHDTLLEDELFFYALSLSNGLMKEIYKKLTKRKSSGKVTA
jgi:hypothetical protein